MCDCSYPSQLAERRGHLAHKWTTEKLTNENKDFLASLPTSIRRDKLLFVHGSPNSQHEYLLPDMDAFAALERVEMAGAETLFCGHTHLPYVRELGQGSIRITLKNTPNKQTEEKEINLPMRRIINAGSVGEPRHGGSKATYVIFDDKTNKIDIKEVSYDIDRTCKAIIEAGLPPIFAWRLNHGFEFAELAEDASHVRKMIERWALISGLKGDLETYERIQKNLKKIRGDITLFVLGDMVGAERNCNSLIDRLINPTW